MNRSDCIVRQRGDEPINTSQHGIMKMRPSRRTTRSTPSTLFNRSTLTVTSALAFALTIALSAAGGSAMATEEPKYIVNLKEDNVELRDYPAMVAAEVRVTGDRSEASSQGFRLLAGYIFGGNTKKQSIAMTAPVVQAAGAKTGSQSGSESESEKIAMTAPVLQTGQSGSWTVRFLMPSSHTMETLPKPNDARVRLVPVPPARMAVVQFSGLAREDDIAAQTAVLNTFVTRRKLVALGTPALARYNPPWTPWFMRRNEIMVAVQP